MKHIYSLSLGLLFAFNTTISVAQSTEINKAYKTQTIETLSQLINDFYVFPEVALKTEKHLKSQLKSGHFKSIDTKKNLAKALTESVQSVNKDKHMRIHAIKPYVEPENTPQRKVEERINFLNRFRFYNGGLNTVKVMEGNVGYLDLRGFARYDQNKHMVDAYMTLLANCDALIIDLSKNGGGDPHMVRYLCSYFFDQKLHLNSLYWREKDFTQEFWTQENVGGVKMPDIPLVVITSEFTFSGAEEFSYNMQTQKRATLIGQTTGGGANPGRTMRINNDLDVFIPTGKAINPITKTNWEGVGVIPEIKTDIDETQDKAYALAKEKAKTFREHREKKFNKLYLELIKSVESDLSDRYYSHILKQLTTCKNAHVLEEGDINMLGYNYLLEEKKTTRAEYIFKANTELYPLSSNVYDSYAEALVTNGNIKGAIAQYKKAVSIAEENKEPNLNLFKTNLQKAEQLLK